ncbi:ABC transporter permease [Microbacteriaceae bacterium VKM Ac-2854]|nr:ABC transporter permease [Microbacteriaceae bacterium VKM Ac-2854]
MRLIDLLRCAVANSFRSRLRTSLTVIAIFIGALTLTITNGIGTGISQYVDATVSSIGAKDVLTVTKQPENRSSADGPTKYDPDAATVQSAFGSTPALAQSDLDAIATIPGITSVTADLSASPDYVQSGEGDKYQLSVSALVTGMTLELAAGDEPDNDATQAQIALPVSFVKPLGFASNTAAVGTTVHLGVTDVAGEPAVLDAVVSGVQEATLGAGSGASVNETLMSALATAEAVGGAAVGADGYLSATARFDSSSPLATIKTALTDDGYEGQTVEDQIGAFKAVIDGIVGVLNAFAVIALIAAGFGIVNTLLMSVQERTREIGLMKAMGLGGGRIFVLFSAEAVFIGFLGSALGALVGIVLGSIVSAALSGSLLADLPGLTLIAFDPLAVAAVVFVVMLIAFVAGTLPAARAARQNPIDALRYE